VRIARPFDGLRPLQEELPEAAVLADRIGVQLRVVRKALACECLERVGEGRHARLRDSFRHVLKQGFTRVCTRIFSDVSAIHSRTSN
jgi:hypothetical protein